jgi:hypothetical protein
VEGGRAALRAAGRGRDRPLGQAGLASDPPRTLADGAGLCCYRPDRSRARLAFHTQPDAYSTQALIEVVGELRRFVHGAKVTLLWAKLKAVALANLVVETLHEVAQVTRQGVTRCRRNRSG